MVALGLAGLAATASCSGIIGIDELPAPTEDTARLDASTGDATVTDGALSDATVTDASAADGTLGDSDASADGASALYSASLELPADPTSITVAQRFGTSLAFSPDGTWLAVGAAGQNDTGAIELFQNVGGVWTSRGTSTSTAFTSGAWIAGEFGLSVAFSGNGQLLAVGSPHEPTSEQGGASNVFLYTFTGTSYVAATVLANPATLATNGFGYSVAFNPGGAPDAGTYLFVGAPGGVYPNHIGGSGAVFAYPVFPDSGVDGSCYSTMVGESLGDAFGYSLASSADLSTIVIGAPAFDLNGGGADIGKVYVVSIQGFDDMQEAGSPPGITGTAHSFFGASVGVTSDGSSILVGAPSTPSYGGTGTGSALRYAPPYFENLQEDTFVPSVSSNALFGQSVAISEVGIAIGAPGEGPAGAVYFFPRISAAGDPPAYSHAAVKLFPADAGEPSAGFGSSLATTSSGAELAVGQPGDAATPGPQNPVYVFH